LAQRGVAGFGDQTHAADLPIYTFAEPLAVPIGAAPQPAVRAAGAADEVHDVDIDTTEDTGNDLPLLEQGAQAFFSSSVDSAGFVVLAMGLSFLAFMRQRNSSEFHFGPLVNDFMTHVFIAGQQVRTLNIPEAIRSAFSPNSTCGMTVVSSLTGNKGHVLLESAARFDPPATQTRYPKATDDPRSFLWLVLNLSLFPELSRIRFFLALAFFDCKSAQFDSFDGARGTTNIMVTNTFRYLPDGTLVVLLAILLPDTNEAKDLPFPGNKLLLVAEKLDTGEWKAFLVSGLSLMPFYDENHKQLPLSYTMPPLTDEEATAVSEAGLSLLQKDITDNDLVHLISGRGTSWRTVLTPSLKGRNGSRRKSVAKVTDCSTGDAVNSKENTCVSGNSKRSRDSGAPKTDVRPKKKKKDNKKVEASIQVLSVNSSDDEQPKKRAKAPVAKTAKCLVPQVEAETKLVPAADDSVAAKAEAALLKQELLQQQQAFKAKEAQILEDAKAKAESDHCKRMLLQQQAESEAKVNEAREGARAETEAALFKKIYEQSRNDAATREAKFEARELALAGEKTEMRAHQLKMAEETTNVVGITAGPKAQARHEGRALVAAQMPTKPIVFDDAFEASAAKLEEASEMKRTAKSLPDGSTSQMALLKIAKESELEARSIMAAYHSQGAF